MTQHSARPFVVDTSQSTNTRLFPVALPDVILEDGFWAWRRGLNREVTLPRQFEQLEETGRLDNFRRAAGWIQAPFQGFYFNDSDVYKWLEAAAWHLATDSDTQLEQMVEKAIDEIEAAQDSDGYLDTYFALERKGERWSNLRDMHELYCAGHLFQAAVAHYRATGSERLLKVAKRLAGHISTVFGPDRRRGTPGHPEIEMALVELYRATGDGRYLDLARFFLDERGNGLIGGRDYHLDHRPFRQMDRLTGHAVRALYLCAGAADVCAESGEMALQESLEHLWEHLVSRQMYVNGGVGPHHQGEAIGADFELPNRRAYAETCAAIASVMWNWRMLQMKGEARFADQMEWTLYNAVLPGISLDGREYFYENPLADDGGHRREPWFSCACCPPNYARTLAALPGYFYSLSREGVWVHLYSQNRASLTLLDGRQVVLTQTTNYPWEGEITLRVVAIQPADLEKPLEKPLKKFNKDGDAFSLFLRIPIWSGESGSVCVQVNEDAVGEELTPGTYHEIRRTWQPGDVVLLRIPMPVRTLESHPYVFENTGRVAVARGPILYCCEGVDNPGIDLRDVILRLPSLPREEFRPDLLGGVVSLHLDGIVNPPDAGWENRLYRTLQQDPSVVPVISHSLTAVPYYAWANREASPLQVWLRWQK